MTKKPTVSITCIDALHYYPTILALNRTIATLQDKVNLVKVYWFSDIEYPEPCAIPVQSIQVAKFTDYIKDYNHITLKLCPDVVDTDFNIVIHADGYAVNKDAWTNKFFDYDYIGAKWHRANYPTYNVGNGGFTLRSKKLLSAIKKVITNTTIDYSQLDSLPYSKKLIIDREYIGHLTLVAEDTLICRTYAPILQKEYGIKFAPADIADRFSIEEHIQSPWLGKSLGFHGKHGIAAYYGVTL